MKLLRLIVFIICLAPFVQIVYGAITQNLGVNPVETMIRSMGDWALYFLMLSLSVTPARYLFGWVLLIRYRRMLGLYAFFYACVHFLSYLWFEHYFDWAEIVADIVKRPFITIGFLSLLLLLPLALTSSQYMIRKLGKNWSRLHKLIYLIAILVVLHFFMMVKADYFQPILFSLLAGFLLGFRLLIYIKK